MEGLNRFEMNLFSFIKEKNLISGGDTILVGVSGGVDSMVLLHSLKRISRFINFEIICAHLNHAIRRESDQEMRFVVETARSWGIEVIAEKIDVIDYKNRMKLSLEESARTVRMNFLKRTAEKVGANKIALAHNMNDRVENFFIRLFRGSGLRGITSMRVREGMIIRPLLNVTRKEIEDYARDVNLKYVVDRSNYDLRFTRNRIRHLLLPFIREKICSSVDERIWNFLMICDELWDYVHSRIKEEYEKLVIRETTDSVEISTDIVKEHPFVMNEILRMAYENLKGDLRNLNFEKLNKVRELILKGKNFEYNLGSSIFVESSFGKIRLFKSPEDLTDTSFEYKIDGEGIFKFDPPGIMVKFSTVNRAPWDLGDGKTKAVFDLKKLKFPLILRNRRTGDRIRPLGMKGHKKVKDVMIERKINRRLRGKIPILTDADGRIMWIVGYIVSEDFKVDPNTEKVLIVEILNREN